MSILESASNPVVRADDDSAAIAALATAFVAQKQAFSTDRNPPIEVRRERLIALIGMMMANREKIGDALIADFGAHPRPATDLIEVLGVVGRAQYVLEHLEEWIKPSVRHTEAALHGTAQAFVQYQPKGVIGNIVPWNFPFDLSVGPLTEMLAAGNRVIIKPSEYTPACGELLREMVAAAFAPELVHVAVGGLELAQAFSATPWDHLLYTGSPNVGRQVMQAAAANLTPVTLELGGKCPAIMTPGSVNAANVESVVGTKIIKNGQMCISVDYALVPRDEVDAFVDHATAFMAEAAPDYARGGEVTGIISPRHLARLTDMLEQARERQGRIVTLEEDDSVDLASRRMPMSLVIDPAADLRIMQEEIFGPILPVVPYDDLDTAVAQINAGERPLGLYVFGDDATLTRDVVDRTHSGGACVNTCAVQGALPSLGFGGSGMSGMGRHHGIEGFREFSNQRGVVIRGEGDMISAFYSPYATAAGLVDAVLSGGVSKLRTETIESGEAATKLSIWSWALFQGGRDPYVILITIYVFVPYLVTSVIGDPVRGQALVASGAKYAGWLVMLTAPLLGATVDRLGRRKPWLVGVVALMVPLVAVLWWAKPGGEGLSVTAIITVLALLGALFAYTETLHNALLIPAAGMKRAGEASGLALALGNLVSVTLLAFTLWAFALPGKVAWDFVPHHPLFGLVQASHQPDRIVGPIIAVLLVLFTLPLLRFVRDVAPTGVKLVRALPMAVRDLKDLVVEARGHRDALVYLGSRLLFTDGLTGILIFTGIYAAGAMGWQTLQLLAYGLILSSFSVIGGLLAGWLDGRVGPKRALTIEIVGVIASQLLLLGNTRTSFFYRPFDPMAHAPLWNGPMFTTAPEIGLILASMVGAVTVTAAYASSRTMLTRVAPPDKIGIFFGLFVIAGTATMWLGPLLVQLATLASGSQRMGLLPLSGLLLGGLAVLKLVRVRSEIDAS